MFLQALYFWPCLVSAPEPLQTSHSLGGHQYSKEGRDPGNNLGLAPVFINTGTLPITAQGLVKWLQSGAGVCGFSSPHFYFSSFLSLPCYLSLENTKSMALSWTGIKWEEPTECEECAYKCWTQGLTVVLDIRR